MAKTLKKIKIQWIELFTITIIIIEIQDWLKIMILNLIIKQKLGEGENSIIDTLISEKFGLSSSIFEILSVIERKSSIIFILWDFWDEWPDPDVDM